MAILFTITSAVSIIAMKLIEFEAAGFYLPFYMPLGGIALCGATDIHCRNKYLLCSIS